MTADPTKWEDLPGNADNLLIVDTWMCNWINLFYTIVVRANRAFLAPEIVELNGVYGDMGFQMVEGSSKAGILLEHPNWQVYEWTTDTRLTFNTLGVVGDYEISAPSFPYDRYVATVRSPGVPRRVISPVYAVADLRVVDTPTWGA